MRLTSDGTKSPIVKILELTVRPSIQFGGSGEFIPKDPTNPFANDDDREMPHTLDETEPLTIQFLEPKNMGPPNPAAAVIWIYSAASSCVLSYRGQDVCRITQILERVKRGQAS